MRTLALTRQSGNHSPVTRQNFEISSKTVPFNILYVLRTTRSGFVQESPSTRQKITFSQAKATFDVVANLLTKTSFQFGRNFMANALFWSVFILSDHQCTQVLVMRLCQISLAGFHFPDVLRPDVLQFSRMAP
ncbi:hypothetical protein E3A64_20235 [Salmonella enterica]|nr:hypothetical protein [Salmonella enterica]EAT7575735.1 hypothetical protein [Salmonella enterica]